MSRMRALISGALVANLLAGSFLVGATPASAGVTNKSGGVLVAARRRSKKAPAKRPATVARTKATEPDWSANIKVPYRSWLPRTKTRPREVMLCVHGLGFSSKSYTQFGRQMAARGIAVYAIDVRGFGEWAKRKQTVDFEACILDIEDALKTLRKFYPNEQITLVGESMGGAIALVVASRYPKLADALISSVPSSERYGNLKSEIFVGMHYVEDKNEEIDMTHEVVDKATDDQKLREQWSADPLNRMQLTPDELKQFNEFMNEGKDAAALVETIPVLMLAGFEDKLVKPEGTIQLFNDLSTEDKLLMVVGDGEHLLLEENQLTPDLRNLVYTWLRNH